MKTPQDRNFDGLVAKFKRNIYGSSKGEIRFQVLWQDMVASIPALVAARPLRVLDAGGGLGQMAIRLAQQGHQVTLTDLSGQMLQQARESIYAQGLMERIELVHAPVQALDQHLAEPYDVIVFHAVLEWLVEPRATLHALLHWLKPGGYLSLMFYNKQALIFSQVCRGNFELLRQGQLVGRKKGLTPINPLAPDEVAGWLDDWRLEPISKAGIRIFHDYVKYDTQDSEKLAGLLEMEQAYCRQEPFASMGRYIHLVCRKPTDS